MSFLPSKLKISMKHSKKNKGISNKKKERKISKMMGLIQITDALCNASVKNSLHKT